MIRTSFHVDSCVLGPNYFVLGGTIFWRNYSLVSMKWSWRTCKQGRCRDFSKDTAPPPPRLQVESLPFKTIQKLFWWKYSLVKSWDFFPPPPLAKMLQYLVGGKVDAAQATFSKLYQIIYGTLLTYLSISLYYPFGNHFQNLIHINQNI